MALPDITTIKECPHCGSEDGFTVINRVTGTSTLSYSFDGAEPENGNMHDELKFTPRKYAQCISCDETIGAWTSESLSVVTDRAKGYSFTR